MPSKTPSPPITIPRQVSAVELAMQRAAARTALDAMRSRVQDQVEISLRFRWASKG